VSYAVEVEGTSEVVKIVGREALDPTRPLESTVLYSEDGRKFRPSVLTMVVAEITENTEAPSEVVKTTESDSENGTTVETTEESYNVTPATEAGASAEGEPAEDTPVADAALDGPTDKQLD